MLFLSLNNISEAQALSDEIKNQAKRDLAPACYELFAPPIIPFSDNYQTLWATNRVFVATPNKENQKCAFSFGLIGAGYEKITQKALDKCNALYGSNLPCEVYARDNNIIFVSQSARLNAVEPLYKNNKMGEIKPILEDIERKGLSSLSIEERGRYEFYIAKTLLDTLPNLAINHFNLSWSSYSFTVSAAEEARLISSSGLSQNNWQSLRNSSKYFLDRASPEEKVLYPDIDEKYHLTDSYFTAESAAQSEKDRVAKVQQDIDDKRNEKIRIEEEKRFAALQKIEEAKAARESKLAAERQKIEEAKALREAKLLEKQRLAQEKRIANEGDGSQDDLACKSFGAKPNTEPYKQCRLKLTEKSNQQQLEEIQSKQRSQALEDARRTREYQARLLEQQRLADQQRQMIEAQRLTDERVRAQQQADQETDGWRALMGLGFGMMRGNGAAPIQSQSINHYLKSEWYSGSNHMCRYDDGSVLNAGVNICPISK